MNTTGLSVDALNGNYFVANAVVVPDGEYWTRFGASVQEMWEQHKQFISVSSMDARRIEDLVKSSTWADDALFTFVEGLLMLKRDYPDRVNLGA